MPKVSEAHLQARREQILEGARRTFARHGYEGATVARLEEEIGLSRGAIFHYFPDKWSLFVALAAEDQNRLLDLMLEEGFDETLRQLARENPDWLGVYFELTRRFRQDPELLKQFSQRAGEEREREVEQRLRELHASGAFRADIDLESTIALTSASPERSPMSR